MDSGGKTALTPGLFAGGGRMGERMAAYDWAASPLGPPETWPQGLKAVIRIMLTSRYAMWMGWGPDLTFFCNDAYAPTLGVKVDRAIGAPASKVWAEIWEDVLPLVDKVIGAGQSTYDEGLLLFLERSGFPEETYHTFSYSPVFDDAGAVAGLFCVVVEETERLIDARRLNTLRELSARTVGARSVADACARATEGLSANRKDVPYALIYLVDSDRRVLHLCGASGLEPPHPSAPPDVPLDHPEFPELGQAMATGETIVCQIAPARRDQLPLHADGWESRPERSAIVPLAPSAEGGAIGVLAVALNPYRPFDENYQSFLKLLGGQIAAAIANAQGHEDERGRADAMAELSRLRERAAEQVRDSEERLRHAVRATGIGIWDVHPQEGRRDWSPEFLSIMGASGEVRPDSDYFASLIHPDDREAINALYAQAYADPDRNRYAAEFRILRGDDGAERWVRTEGLVSFDDQGQAVRGTGTLLDITERRQIEAELEARVAERTVELAAANRQLLAQIAERERVEEALRRSQRLEAVGQLTSGVAHDFNNLLTVILGNIGFLMRDATPDAARRLEMMRAAASRGANLTGQLLAFSRRQRLEAKRIDLNEAVEAMRELLQSTLGGGIRISTELQQNLWPALVDPTQFELVVLNLAINARDAMGVGGSLTVATANMQLGEPVTPEDPPAGDYVMVAITDTGSGMTADVLAKAFEPFFTTKEPGKGSGLGLAQVFGFARQSGGGVRITTALGEGTTVAVYLPRARQVDLEAAVPEAVAQPRPEAGITLLVVDDDSAVREVTSALLRERGYLVEEAASGAGALEIIGLGQRIDAIVADYAMPGMNGVQLAQAARQLRPGLPVVFLTGYADIEALTQAGERYVVQKPFQTEDLDRRLQAAMAEAISRP